MGVCLSQFLELYTFRRFRLKERSWDLCQRLPVCTVSGSAGRPSPSPWLCVCSPAHVHPLGRGAVSLPPFAAPWSFSQAERGISLIHTDPSPECGSAGTPLLGLCRVTKVPRQLTSGKSNGDFSCWPSRNCPWRVARHKRGPQPHNSQDLNPTKKQ